MPGSKVSQQTVSETKTVKVTNAASVQKALLSEKPVVKVSEKPSEVTPKVANAAKKPGKC